MISPACGSIWMPIIKTMKIFRPVKRNFASATAAKNARTIDSATVTDTTIRELTTDVQKYGWSVPAIASRKCWSVGWSGAHDPFVISLSDLNAVAIIQYTGNTMT